MSIQRIDWAAARLEWVCDYPEFNEPHCTEQDHDIEKVHPAQQRKHRECGMTWLIPLVRDSV